MPERRSIGKDHRQAWKKLALIPALIIVIISLSYVPAATAFTTQFNKPGGGNALTFTEAAQQSATGSQVVNQSQFSFVLPTDKTNWQGYRLAASVNFNNTRQFLTNPGFDGTLFPWTWTSAPQGNDGSNMTGGYTTASYPTGSILAGAGYNTLIGKTTVLNATNPNPLITNMNFTSNSNGWSTWSNGSSHNWNSGYPLNSWTSSYGGAMEMAAQATGAETCSVDLWLNTTFPYNGLAYPDLAWITYSYWVPTFSFGYVTSETVQYDMWIQNLTTPTAMTKIVSTTPITSTSSQPSRTSSAPFSANIAPYLTKGGISYRITVHLKINVIMSYFYSSASVEVCWSNIGVYAKYGKFNKNSLSYVDQTNINFGRPALAANLTFWYWTNMTTLVPATDSNITVWLNNGTSIYTYFVTSFSSAVKGTWTKVNWMILPSQISINNAPSLEVRLGLILGTGLQITKSAKYSVLYDNVTLNILYRPLPADVNLRISDIQRGGPPTPLSGTVAGQGSVVLNAPPPWTTSSNPSFQFVAGLGQSQVKVSYLATLYVKRIFQSNKTSLLFSSALSTGNWVFNYSIPKSGVPNGLSGLGYQYYNINVTVPNDWSLGDVTYGGIDKTTLCSIVTNGSVTTTRILVVPSGVFGGQFTSWGYLLVLQTSSPNYLYPPGALFTQVNATDGPAPTSWKNATAFYPGNYTKLVAYFRNSTGGIRGIGSTSCNVTLWNNRTGTMGVNKTWTSIPVGSSGNAAVQLFWGSNNLTSSSAPTMWSFEAQWTNGFDAAERYVNFTTSGSKTIIIPTTLSATPTNFLGGNSIPFNTTESFYVTYSNSINGSGITGAIAKWNWVGNTTTNTMIDIGGGKYNATIGNHEIAAHYGSNTISVTLSKSGFSPQTILIGISVRPINTELSLISSFTPNPVPWGNVSSLQVQFWDLDHNRGIINKVGMQVNESTLGFASYVTITPQSGGYFTININSSFAGTVPSNYAINVTATRWGYQNASLPTFPVITVRDRQTSCSFSTTSFVTPVNDPFAFVLTFKDTDLHGAGVPLATVNVNWTSKSITEQGGGNYLISLTGTSQIRTYVLNITVSETHYSTSTILQSFTVRQIYTGIASLNGTLIAVPWGRNATIDLRYMDLDHSLNITGAQLFVTSGWQSGYWSYKWNPGTLAYRLTLNTTINTEGDFQVTVEINKTNYQQSVFTLTVRIRLINTACTAVPGSLVIVYTDNATFTITFNDTDNGNVGINGGSYSVYGWPYVVVPQANPSRPGVYTFTFVTFNSTVSVTVPNAITITLYKANYVTQSVQLSLTVNRVSTGIIVPATMHVTYGLQIVFNVTFEDLNHTKGIDNYAPYYSASVSCNWTESSPSVTSLGNGVYQFILSSTSNGSFVIQVTASAYPYYDQAIGTFNLIVGIVPTTASWQTAGKTPWGDQANVYIVYDVNSSGSQISGINITTNWTLPYTPPTRTATGYQVGFYTTNLTEGVYGVRIYVSKEFYETQTLDATIIIRPINMTIQYVSAPSQVIAGSPANITFQLWDTDHSRSITNASLVISGVGSHFKWHELPSGYYEVDVDTSWVSPPTTLQVSINATKTHYELSVPPSQVTLKVIPIPGLSPMMVVLAGGGGGGAVILAILGYVIYRRRKIPFVIKKIDQSIGLINKGEVLEPVPMKTRAQMIDGIYQTKLAILSKEKIEEVGKKKEKKEAKRPEKTSEIKTGEAPTLARVEAHAEAAGAGAKVPEGREGAERGEADVALIAEELERLETKGGAEPIRETDLIKREMEELEKEAKKKKKRSD